MFQKKNKLDTREKKINYAIKKLTIGAVSLCIGAVAYLGHSGNAHAEESHTDVAKQNKNAAPLKKSIPIAPKKDVVATQRNVTQSTAKINEQQNARRHKKQQAVNNFYKKRQSPFKSAAYQNMLKQNKANAAKLNAATAVPVSHAPKPKNEQHSYHPQPIYTSHHKEGQRVIDTVTHYDAAGIESSKLKYARTTFDAVGEQGIIKLTVTKWSSGPTGWKSTSAHPYAGKYLLNFDRPKFYKAIDKIEIFSDKNRTQFQKEKDGALWHIDIEGKTLKTGQIGVVTNNNIIIHMKQGKTLKNLGLSQTPIGYSTLWVKGNGKIARESINNGFILESGSKNIPNDDVRHTESGQFMGYHTGKVGKSIVLDVAQNVIKSTNSFKPNGNYLQSLPSTVAYIKEQIPNVLLPFIDIDNIWLGASDELGNFTTKNPLKVRIDRDGLVDSSRTPEISIIGNDTLSQRKKARVRLDRDVFFGPLGRYRNYSIHYQLKPRVDLSSMAETINDYIIKHDNKLYFESWVEVDRLNHGRPILDKPDQGASPKQLVNSYANGYLETNDSDKDGIFDFVEFNMGTHIHKVDTDGDGVPDGIEQYKDHTNARDAKDYLVSRPLTDVTVMDATQNQVLKVRVPKEIYYSSDRKQIPVTNEDAGNVIVKLHEYDAVKNVHMSKVFAEARIPYQKLRDGSITLNIAKNTLMNSTHVVAVAYSPNGQHYMVGSPIVVRREAQAEQYPPVIKEVHYNKALPPKAEDIIGAVTVPNAPEGTAIDIDPPFNGIADEVSSTDVPVTVSYPDGSHNKVRVPVRAIYTFAEQFYANSHKIDKKRGQATTYEEIVQAVEVEPGAPPVTIRVDSPIPTGETAGVKRLDVYVVFPDKSEYHVYVDVHVAFLLADINSPNVSRLYLPKDAEITEEMILSQVDLTTLPAGTTVSLKKPMVMPDTHVPTLYLMPAEVRYADDSIDNIRISVIVNPSLADLHTANIDVLIVPKGEPITVEMLSSVIAFDRLPEGTRFEPLHPDKLPDGNIIGRNEVKGKIVYPDGSFDFASVQFAVKRIKK